MLTDHDRNAHRFEPAVTGEYEEAWYKLPRMSSGWIMESVKSRRDADLDGREGYDLTRRAKGWDTLLRALAHVLREIQHGDGCRFQISSRRLAEVLGMSQSTGSRCLRRLREMGILKRYREHRVRFSHKLRRWLGKAAVHEVMTHPFGDPLGKVSHDALPART